MCSGPPQPEIMKRQADTIAVNNEKGIVFVNITLTCALCLLLLLSLITLKPLKNFTMKL